MIGDAEHMGLATENTKSQAVELEQNKRVRACDIKAGERKLAPSLHSNNTDRDSL